MLWPQRIWESQHCKWEKWWFHWKIPFWPCCFWRFCLGSGYVEQLWLQVWIRKFTQTKNCEKDSRKNWGKETPPKQLGPAWGMEIYSDLTRPKNPKLGGLVRDTPGKIKVGERLYFGRKCGDFFPLGLCCNMKGSDQKSLMGRLCQDASKWWHGQPGLLTTCIDIPFITRRTSTYITFTYCLHLTFVLLMSLVLPILLMSFSPISYTYVKKGLDFTWPHCKILMFLDGLV